MTTQTTASETPTPASGTPTGLIGIPPKTGLAIALGGSILTIISTFLAWTWTSAFPGDLTVYGYPGGLQVLEDRMYGYHEGYLVTPISTGTLVAGNILAGAVVAAIAGGLVLTAVVIVTPVPIASGANLAGAFVTVFLTSLSISALWFLLFARAKSTSLLRGMFGIINVLLFFPSGALYPIESYPAWLAKLSMVDPLTYGVRALRNLILRGSAPSAAYADWVFLATFTLVAGVLTKVLFKREV